MAEFILSNELIFNSLILLLPAIFAIFALFFQRGFGEKIANFKKALKSFKYERAEQLIEVLNNKKSLEKEGLTETVDGILKDYDI